ncbi:MAG: hypothetical protein V4629_13580 [Pseudomonadota bacterium]
MTLSAVQKTATHSEIVLRYSKEEERFVKSQTRQNNKFLRIKEKKEPISSKLNSTLCTPLHYAKYSSPLRSPSWWLSNVGHFLQGAPEARHWSLVEWLDAINLVINLGLVIRQSRNNFYGSNKILQEINLDYKKKLIYLTLQIFQVGRGCAITGAVLMFHMVVWGAVFALVHHLFRPNDSSTKIPKLHPSGDDLLIQLQKWEQCTDYDHASKNIINETRIGNLLKSYVNSGAFKWNSLFESYPLKETPSLFNQLKPLVEKLFSKSEFSEELLKSIRTLDVKNVVDLIEKFEKNKSLLHDVTADNSELNLEDLKQSIRYVLDYASISTLGRLLQILYQEERTALNSVEKSIWLQAENRLQITQAALAGSPGKELLKNEMKDGLPLLIKVSDLFEYFKECRQEYFNNQPDVYNRSAEPPKIPLANNQFKLMQWLSAQHAHQLKAEFQPPKGPAIFAINHSLYTFDISMAINQMAAWTSRYGYMMVDRAIFAIPGGREFLFALGYRQGDRRTFIDLLTPNKKSEGHCLYVAPGGMAESIKSFEQANQLKWNRAQGFIISHLITGAPLYLLFSDNADYIRESRLPRMLQRMQDRLFKYSKLPLITMFFAPHTEQRVPLTHHLSMRITAPPLPMQLQGQTVDEIMKNKIPKDFLMKYHKAVCTAAEQFMKDIVNQRRSPKKIADVSIDGMTQGEFLPKDFHS